MVLYSFVLLARLLFTSRFNQLRSTLHLIPWLTEAGPNLRIGGNSADESAYTSGPLPPGDTYRITDADLLSYNQVRRQRFALPSLV